MLLLLKKSKTIFNKMELFLFPYIAQPMIKV